MGQRNRLDVGYPHESLQHQYQQDHCRFFRANPELLFRSKSKIWTKLTCHEKSFSRRKFYFKICGKKCSGEGKGQKCLRESRGGLNGRQASVTSKKSPNVYKSCPKIISQEKLNILTPLKNCLISWDILQINCCQRL